MSQLREYSCENFRDRSIGGTANCHHARPTPGTRGTLLKDFQVFQITSMQRLFGEITTTSTSSKVTVKLKLDI
jgi:hypothetical protein